VSASLSLREIARELADYEVALPDPELEKLSLYLELLQRWNRRINLTGLREPRAMVRRLFGESLYISRVVELRGRLVDVGSGAGFPGLALKLVAPDLQVTLVEARQRKCAFLKEVARECGFYAVDVVPARFESWQKARKGPEKADLITTRAVKTTPAFLDGLAGCLKPDGKAVFSTTSRGAKETMGIGSGWNWETVVPVPNAGNSVIIVGSLL